MEQSSDKTEDTHIFTYFSKLTSENETNVVRSLVYQKLNCPVLNTRHSRYNSSYRKKIQESNVNENEAIHSDFVALSSKTSSYNKQSESMGTIPRLPRPLSITDENS